MWTQFYQWPKIPKNFTFWNFLHYNKAFDFVTFIHLCTLILKVFVVRILGQNVFFKHYLWIFELLFSRNKVLNYFPRLGRNIKTCSNLTCYAYNSTLVMYLSMKKIKLSIWICYQVTTSVCEGVHWI
jgi:hypothetical protein